MGGKQMLEEVNQFPERPELLSPTIMAYVGDSLFEMFIRTYLLEQNVCKPNELHQQAVEHVNAEAQAELLAELRPELTDQEQTIVRRGRNAKTNIPSSADRSTYQYSTAFEALLGYLYLAEEEERLQELFAQMREYYTTS